MKYIALILILIPVIASSNEVEYHKSQWESKEIKDYSYTLKRGGVFGYSLYKIRIKAGSCKAKSKYIYTRKPIFWKKDTCEGNTIRELYEAVIKQMEQNVDKMDIAFDKKYNFISSFLVEPKTEATDQDWHFEVMDFEVD